MNKIHLIVTAASLGLLVACASNKPQTIGSLTYTPPPREKESVAPSMSHQEVRQEYTDLLSLFEDQHLSEQIERRIADVYMMEGVHQQNQAGPISNHYLEAIKAYRNILKKYPDSPDNAEVLYQLAKAYDLEGDQEQAMAMLAELTSRHPYYPNVAEAHFRMGDIYFNNQNYRAAQHSYQAVTGYDNERLTTNARYMLGWSYYKQSQFEHSLREFSTVLDSLMAETTDLDQVSDAARPMAADTIHSISLALDKVGGAEAIAHTMSNIKSRGYIWLIYDNLGEYYLEKELYEASAETFRLFVGQHRHSDKAPVLHSKIIHTYVTGGFPSLALKEKESYVKAYGLRSNYAGNRAGMKPQVAASVKIYLDELARHYYNLGQTLQSAAANDQAQTQKAQDQEQLQVAEQQQPQKIDPEALDAYYKAADYYGQYTQTFPNDQRIDEVYFLMSESLFLAQRYTDAISGYERVAYQPVGNSAEQHASNAGYAAIISYQKHIATYPSASEQIKVWQAQAVESMLRFANTFHDDDRAVSVLTNAAEYLFSLNQYSRALQVSSDLIKNNKQLDKTLKKTAYGIVAHSHFNLGDFHNAELNYLKQRDLVAPDSQEHQRISERLATAIYRHSEQIDARGESDKAVSQLLKIKRLTPNSKLRVPAQYEAATMLINREQWSQAITELNELIALFPDHELSLEFPRRLAFAHEQNQDWHLAAISYQKLFEQDPDADIRQEALFIAGTMFENDKNYHEAIKAFRQYANSYEHPASTLMEARYNLAVNYQRVGDTDRHLFWLQRLVEGERQFSSSDRNRWLSSWANAQYGDHYAREFRRFSLYLPLASSIPPKNEMLTKAAQRYQMSAELGILEFTTLSSYKIADLYRRFAQDLREAPRPSLTHEEQSVYAEIIEEQALPLEQLAMELYQANIDRAWTGEFNQWIDQSFAAMRAMNPRRFNKAELIVSYGDEIR